MTLAVHVTADHIEFAVTDSGIGMTPEHLTNLMGGRLAAESQAGIGTTFRFKLPLNPPA